MSFKPIDAKRDEYRKYLERTGVLELLSKVIIKLFECQNKPENAIEFIRENMGDAMLEGDTITSLKQELEDSRNEVAQLKRALENLKLQNNKSVANAEVIAAAPSVAEESKVDKNLVENDEHDTNDDSSDTIRSPSEQEDAVADEEKEEVFDEENKQEITEPNEESLAAADPVADEKLESNNKEQVSKDAPQKDKDAPQKDAESKAE